MAPEPQADPIAVLLARIEVKLDNSLAEQARHTSAIERIDKTVGELGNRVTILETTQAGDQRAEQRAEARTYSGKVLTWTAVGSIAMAISVTVGILLTVKGHG